MPLNSPSNVRDSCKKSKDIISERKSAIGLHGWIGDCFDFSGALQLFGVDC